MNMRYFILRMRKRNNFFFFRQYQSNFHGTSHVVYFEPIIIMDCFNLDSYLCMRRFFSSKQCLVLILMGQLPSKFTHIQFGPANEQLLLRFGLPSAHVQNKIPFSWVNYHGISHIDQYKLSIKHGPIHFMNLSVHAQNFFS